MELPVLLPTSAQSETFAGITYHLDGNLVPALTILLDGERSVYFEHHILLWKHQDVKISIKPMKGALQRMFAGMQVFVTEAYGKGQVALSRDGPGQLFALHLKEGEEIHVREHQFVAATENIEYTFEWVTGLSNILFGKSGFFVDKFRARSGDGILWLHGYGNVFEKSLAAGESIDVEPGAWLYKSPETEMSTNLQKLMVGFVAGTSMMMNRFTGPGCVAIQTMPPPSPEPPPPPPANTAEKSR
ncbi:MAG: AIM24 family protein [Verrucomicrobium sp.]|nr:AIM24 family protein [Verrucomicrobium sp.]